MILFGNATPNYYLLETTILNKLKTVNCQYNVSSSGVLVILERSVFLRLRPNCNSKKYRNKKIKM